MLVTGAAVLAALLAVSLRDPRYEASTKVLVNPLPQNDEDFFGTALVRDSGDTARTALTVTTLIETDEVARLTARRLGGNWTSESVLGAVKVEPSGQSNVVTIEATASDPALAARIANTFARSFFALRRTRLRREIRARIRVIRQELAGVPGVDTVRRGELRHDMIRMTGIVRAGSDPTLSLSATATPPGSPSDVPGWVIVGIALIGGVFLATVAAMTVERFRRSVEGEDELLSLRPLPVLARVPRIPRPLLKHGPIAQAARSTRLREAFRTLAAQVEDREDARRSVLMTSASRGDGRTTSAAGLGLALTEAGYSVILLDFDFANPQLSGAVTTGTTHGLGAMLRSGGNLSDHLLESAVSPGLRVLPAAEASREVWGHTRAVVDVLGEALTLAEYVIVDGPPLTTAGLPLRLAREMDTVVVVARPGHTGREDFEELLRLLDGVDAAAAGLVVTGQAGAPEPGADGSKARRRGSGRKRSALVGSLRR